MKTIPCDKVRENLAGYRDGWLDPPISEMIRLHLLVCTACELDYKKDTALTKALESLPVHAVAPVEWNTVYAAKTRTMRGNHPHKMKKLAYAFSLCGILFLMGIMFEHHNEIVRTVPSTGTVHIGVTSSANSGMRSYMGVDALMSAADITADPNRAELLLYESKKH